MPRGRPAAKKAAAEGDASSITASQKSTASTNGSQKSSSTEGQAENVAIPAAVENIKEVPMEKSAEPVVEEPTTKAPGKRGAPAKEVKEKDSKAAKPAASATAQAPKAAKKEVSEGERRVLPPRAAKTVQK